MDYKNTLNLPKTDFPMKANLAQSEPGRLESWQKQDIYACIRKACAGKEKKILHDGPPYANGNIHLGHVLNKTLKDIVVKYWTMKGFDSVYVPGWDCHGLPIEHQLLKELKMGKHQVQKVEFRKKAHDYAMKYVGIQREQFQRLGVFADWEHPYLTLDRQYGQAIVTVFAELFEKGYIYRGLKPVNWCFRCETALAEAEVEYENHTSPSIYVKFKILNPKDRLNVPDNKPVYAIVWTTTPWTLIANVAIAVHPDFNYDLLDVGKEVWIIQRDLVIPVMEKAGIGAYRTLGSVSGKVLNDAPYEDIIKDKAGQVRSARYKIVLADYVSKEEGTGLVHTAPGHGQEDYLTGQRHKLETVMPVDRKGEFFQDIALEFQGQHVFDANPYIIEKLKNQGNLLHAGTISHTYPHCWRCKTPVIFRATEQWFLDIDKHGLREKLLSVVNDQVSWIPSGGRERIAAMIGLRPHWCLSRQRHWGVPIPALGCNGCGKEFLDPSVIRKFAERVAAEGSDCWFERDVSDFTDETMRCPYCKGRSFIKGSEDILDVWFDSGISHQAVLKKRPELGGVPCELYLEGSDQHRGWFQSSLIPSVCLDGRAPFKKVLTHGFVVDGSGRKMSKSLGNVIAPQDLIKDYGADILRLWVASSDYNEDIRISKEILSRLTEAYRKIRNTARFILSNLYDFDPDRDACAYKDMRRIDAWILRRLHGQLIPAVDSSFQPDKPDKGQFEFYRAYKAIYDFCNQDLSMDYLDMVKGRLYTYAKASRERRAAQTALYEIIRVLVRLIAPFLAFTADEIWQYMPKQAADRGLDSVHLAGWPHVHEEFLARGTQESDDLTVVLGLKPDIARMLEELRSRGEIGSSFDAGIILLTNNQNRYTYLNSLANDMPEIFKVSRVRVEPSAGSDRGTRSSAYSDISIIVQKALGNKCPRCWNYYGHLASAQVHSEICESCLRAVEEVRAREKE